MRRFNCFLGLLAVLAAGGFCLAQLPLGSSQQEPAAVVASSPAGAKAIAPSQQVKSPDALVQPQTSSLAIAVPPPEAAAEAAIRAALDQPFAFEGIVTPLHQVASFIQKNHQIQVEIDRPALTEEGLDPSMEITFQANNRTLRSSLNRMLQGTGLAWYIADETLLISTRDEVESHPVTRVYPVDDLTVENATTTNRYHGSRSSLRPAELINMISSLIAPDSWDPYGESGVIEGASLGGREVLLVSQTEAVHDQVAELLRQIRAVPPAPRPEEPATDLRVHPLSDNAAKVRQEIIDMVQQTVEPESWEQPGIFLKPAASVLVIRQSPANQRKIEELLSEINMHTTPFVFPTFSGDQGDGGGMSGSDN
ncbi:STN domain-containing protein [Lignipirellula cremea]|uniref:Type II secretion system protein D n=1 Tax=Lignipirellula cremea TaxID=2528010 RepID=A0A518DLQ2_9BACT|nr:STN domain-containing protein [Lignipirellula cremea]QDU92767.1 hypothetical protein Pla8534_05160 [Lignipirellula cremea]